MRWWGRGEKKMWNKEGIKAKIAKDERENEPIPFASPRGRV
jgi:hypothetical protein